MKKGTSLHFVNLLRRILRTASALIPNILESFPIVYSSGACVCGCVGVKEGLVQEGCEEGPGYVVGPNLLVPGPELFHLWA